MAHLILDRVLETTTTTGTGIITLNGNVAGFRAFSLLGNGNTTDYLIIDEDRNQWEIGIGTYGSSGNTLSRTTVVLSTNSNNAVNFQTGTKYVKITNAASKTITTDNISTYAQPLDADLTAIAALTGTTGLLKKTAANTWTLDTSAYLTGITSGMVTTALGFTPYNATNPSGYYSSGSNASFGTLSASSTVSGVGFSTYLASPPAIGATTASTGAFTTLSASGAVTLSGGTANGVAYLNGSKVLTTGSALTFDGSNFGIGTSSPSYKLDVNGTGKFSSSSATPLYANSTGASDTIISYAGTGNIILTGVGRSSDNSSKIRFLNNAFSSELSSITETGTSNLAFATATAERMRIDYLGNINIGSGSAAGASGRYLDVQNTGSDANSFALTRYITQQVGSASTTSADVGKNKAGTFFINNNETNLAAAIVLANAGSERMRIDYSGNVFMGKSGQSPTVIGNSFGLSANGVGYNESVSTNTGGTLALWYLNRQSSTGDIFVFRQASAGVGSITVTGSATAYNTTSDYRLKIIFGSVSGSGERIDSLEPVEYEWKSDGLRTRGFLAHKFQEVYPNSVTGEKDAVDADGKPVYQTMQASTSEVIADLVAEIQSLRKRITTLEAK